LKNKQQCTQQGKTVRLVGTQQGKTVRSGSTQQGKTGRLVARCGAELEE
jgi:hypothetical protein